MRAVYRHCLVRVESLFCHCDDGLRIGRAAYRHHCFTDAAARFLREHGVPEARVATVWQAIALHTSAAWRTDSVRNKPSPIWVSGQTSSAPTNTCFRRVFADRVHASWPRHDLGYALAELIAAQVEANPQKGPPLTFPGHLHELMYPTPTVTWFDVVRAAGWNEQPRADRAEASPPAVS